MKNLSKKICFPLIANNSMAICVLNLIKLFDKKAIVYSLFMSCFDQSFFKTRSFFVHYPKVFSVNLIKLYFKATAGTEKIFDKLIKEPMAITSIYAEPMLEVSLFQLYFLVDAYIEVVEDYKNNNPSDKKNYSVGKDISNALDDYDLEYSTCDEILIKRTFLKNLLFDFGEVVKKFTLGTMEIN